jgi:hypothetical protein
MKQISSYAVLFLILSASAVLADALPATKDASSLQDPGAWFSIGTGLVLLILGRVRLNRRIRSHQGL